MKKKEQLKNHIKKWPALSNFFRKINVALKNQYLQELLIGTKIRENIWASRHLRNTNVDDWGCSGKNWVRGYWESQTHPHRQFLIDRINNLLPVSSIMEIGCNSGPNLCLLAKKYSDVKIRGIDINPMAIQKGNEWLAKEGFSNVKLMIGKADELDEIPDNSFDIVFADAVLMYIGPDKIRRVVGEMLRITQKALIIVDWHYFNSKGNKKDRLGVYHFGLWKRDYVALLRQFVPDYKIRLIKIPEGLWPVEGWKELGAVVEVIL